VNGNRLTVSTERVHTERDEVWVGVRPEKIRLIDPTDGVDSNAVAGVVTDVSYIGVSTQYLVRTAWGQELGVFAQNVGSAGPRHIGEKVTMTWDADAAFALDAVQDASAGAERIEAAK
jgi:spermidine/putrescine transport system ATP-binding protein